MLEGPGYQTTTKANLKNKQFLTILRQESKKFPQYQNKTVLNTFEIGYLKLVTGYRNLKLEISVSKFLLSIFYYHVTTFKQLSSNYQSIQSIYRILNNKYQINNIVVISFTFINCLSVVMIVSTPFPSKLTFLSKYGVFSFNFF